MSNLTLGSLFDGSGGFPLGGMLAGITPVWASEIEPFPIRVTTKRLPFMKHYGDISAMDGGRIEPVDIITFGSPCQDMSVAGKRDGLDGSRSSLFWSTSISFSKSSIIALHSCEHILIRVNAKEKCILLSPAPSTDKDSISWLKDAKNLQAKKIDCKLFTSQLYKTWGFDEAYCYRSYGRIVTVDNKVMLLFDFKKSESWKYQSKSKNKENRDG